MSQVLCKLPNASDLINGVAFESTADGMLSEDVSDDVAAAFAAIPGYSIVGAVDPAAAAAADTEKADLLARAAALAMPVKGNWSVARLRTEVEAAEKAAAAKAAEKAAE